MSSSASASIARRCERSSTRLGLGIAIVNAFARTPPGVYSRPLRDLPSVTYRLLRRPHPLSAAAEALRAMIRD